MVVTEDGITDLLADYLRDHGIDVRTQVSISTPGTRDQPDMQVKNGGTFFGEAKWENKKWEGFGEARDYGNLVGANGSFLIAYPEELRNEAAQARIADNIAESVFAGHKFSCAFLRRDAETDMQRLSIEELPEWLKSNVKKRRTPKIDPDEVVSVLRQTAYTLNEELHTAPNEDLFRNVLGATPDEEEEQQGAQETAGFLLVNQIAFYRVLSSHRDFPEIDPDSLGSPADLGEYFELVLDYDYTPVFSFRIADGLSQEALPTLKDAIKSIYALSPERISHDVLGKVFHELIPVSARKKVAAYYTKNRAAEILASIAIDDDSDTVMDPACGSGTLLAASYMQKRDLCQPFVEKDHRRFVEEELTGIDVMPFAAHLSSIHLALQAPIFETDEVNIGIEDSTKLRPGSTISPLSFVIPDAKQQRGLHEYESGSRPDVSEETVEAGSIAMDAASGQEMTLNTVDVVIMNPPFTRQESVASFSENYKDKLKSRLREYEEYIHGLMSFYSYFFLIADRFLEEGGRVAAVVPHTLLTKSTDSGIRTLLTSKYNIEYIFVRDDETNFSEDTDFREIMLIARKGQSKEQATNYVRLQNLEADPQQITSVCEELKIGETKSRNDFIVQSISTNTLNPENLFTPFAVHNPELLATWEEIVDSGRLTTLKSLNTGRIGGVRGGADDPRGYNPQMTINASDAYNTKDSDFWILANEDEDTVIARHRHTDVKIPIPKTALVPNLRGFAGRTTLDVTNLSEYAVIDKFDGFDNFESLIDVDSIPVEAWRSRVEDRTAHLSLVRRANLTAPGLHHMAYYSEAKRLGPNIMWMLSDLNQTQAKILAAWFDSTIGWLQFLLDRVETEGGFGSWRGYLVENFKAPDLNILNPNEFGELLHAFEIYKDLSVGSLAEQLAANVDPDWLSNRSLSQIRDTYPELELGTGLSERRELDKAVLNLLKIPESEHDKVLKKLYTMMLKELVKSKAIMQN